MIRTFPLAAALVGALSFLPLSSFGFAPTRQHDTEKEHGKASWYGAEQGHETASGERFNAHNLTAAHRHLPFGTVILVTNCENGRCVKVRINDRGPWTGGRILDVSSAAADVLEMKRAGIVPVDIQVVQLGGPWHYREE